MIANPTWGTSSSITEYFKESQDNYYKKEGDLGVWQGKAAAALGFRGAITEEHLKSALLGENAKGKKALKQVSIDKETGERTRAGLDLTFNAPKSVSIAYELAKATGNDKLADTLLQIHNEATSKVLDKIEKNYSQARETKDGITEHVDTGNLAIAKFQHDISRPVTDKEGNVTVDPSLHTHAVIMNMTKSADGTYKAIESKKIFENYKSAGMEYRAIMAAELKAAGFEINITDHNKGFYEIGLTDNKEVDEKLIDGLSQRSEQIEKALPALREKYPHKTESELKQMAAHQTREFKGEIDRDKVREDNLNRAVELGMSKEHINELGKNIEKVAELEKNKTPEEKEAAQKEDLDKAKEALKTAIAATTDEKSVFKKEEIIEKAQKFLLQEAIKPEILEKAFKEQFKAKEDDRLLEVRKNQLTTREVLRNEREVLDNLKDSKNKVSQVYIQKEAKEKLTEYSDKEKEKTGYGLTAGQKEAAKLILSSKDSIIGIQGDAGTGKTTMLRAVNELKGDAKIYGLSYTGKAASEIEKATKEKDKENASATAFKQGGIKSSTLASFLNVVDSGKINKTDFKDAKLIVDEASMLGIKDANKLLGFAKEAGAQIIMMGDVKQFKAIGAGDPFQLMQDNGMKTESMSEVLRQKDKTLIKAVSELNKYNSDAAFKTLDDANKIHELKEGDNVIEKIRDDYFANGNKAKDTLAIASVKDTLKNNIILTQTNETKDLLNTAIRDEMKSRDLISKEDIKLNIRESSRLTPSQKYFASNYKDSTNIFLQNDVYAKNGEKLEFLKKGQEFKILNTNEKENTLTVAGKDGSSHVIDLKKNSSSIQAYKEQEKNFSLGEKIVFEKNDKKLGVSNGTTGEIQGIYKDGNILIKTDDKIVNFNTKEYNYFNHGYAVTSYKAQGQTAKNVIAYMPAQGQNFNSFYVVATRAEENLTIYTDSKKDLRSIVHNEQIKDNATSLNEKFEQKEAIDKEQQKQAHENRKLSRQEAYENAPAGAKQLSFAESIAKALNIENADIGKRVNTDAFIKENLEAFQKFQETKPATTKQSDLAQNIADKLHQDIDLSKMNERQTKEFISSNIKEFDTAIKNPVEHLLNVDVSKLSEKQEDSYFKDLTRAEMFSSYKKDLDSLEKLDAKHEKEFPQTLLEEKQIKIDLYITALDIKPADYLEKIVEQHTVFSTLENAAQSGLSTPVEVSKFLKEDGLNYQDEKYKVLSEMIVEKQFDKLMDKSDGTNDTELGERNSRLIEFTQGFKEQLIEAREYESTLAQIEEKIADGDIYNASKMIEENRELLKEDDLKELEGVLEKVIENEFDSVHTDLQKEFEIQEELLLEDLKEDMIEDVMLETELEHEEPENELYQELYEELEDESLMENEIQDELEDDYER